MSCCLCYWLPLRLPCVCWSLLLRLSLLFLCLECLLPLLRCSLVLLDAGLLLWDPRRSGLVAWPSRPESLNRLERWCSRCRRGSWPGYNNGDNNGERHFAPLLFPGVLLA